jgi:hypothetical protein
MCERPQRLGLRARSTLMPTGQAVYVLGEGAANAAGFEALEAPDFDGDGPAKHRAFGQVADVAPVAPSAPALAARTRCRTHRAADPPAPEHGPVRRSIPP